MDRYNTLLISFVVLISLSATAGAKDCYTISEKDKDAIVYIEVTSANLDGTDKHTITGTGFILKPDGYVATAAHLIPDTNQTARVVDIEASIHSRYGHKLPLSVIVRNPYLDFALLALPTFNRWDTLAFTESSTVQVGDSLCAWGFPKISDLSPAPGILSNKTGLNGKWQTTMPLNSGNSGGPVFNSQGGVIGIASGGWDNAQQISYIVPYDLLKLAGGIVTSFVQDDKSEKNLIKKCQINEVLARHDNLTSETTKSFTKPCIAEPGYVITSVQINPTSQTRVGNLLSSIVEGGKKAIISFDLTSGPQLDRYRGWLHADVTLTQEKAPN